MSNRAKRRQATGREGNSKVLMTCAAAEETQETCDPVDRAHSTRGADGFLVSALRAKGTRARRYPVAYMARAFEPVTTTEGTGRMRTVQSRRRFVGEVSFETVYERLAEREARLAEMGLMSEVESVGLQVRRAMAVAESRGVRSLSVDEADDQPR